MQFLHEQPIYLADQLTVTNIKLVHNCQVLLYDDLCIYEQPFAYPISGQQLAVYVKNANASTHTQWHTQKIKRKGLY